MKITRNDFIKILGILPLGLWSRFSIGATGKSEMNFGWTTCLTYETGDRKLGYDYFSSLLDEMHSYGMSHLIVMMASHGYFSPKNHGLAWPVKNEKLKPQLDLQAVNAKEETEFFSKIIKKAHSLNIKVYVEIKYLGMIGIKEGYPQVEFLRKKDGSTINKISENASEYERRAIESLRICCDNTDAHQYIRDKISDVLSRYRDLDGIILEHPSYSGSTCYCRDTRQRLKKETGKEIEELTEKELQSWKSGRIRDTLLDLKKLVKSINPDFEYGFYTGFSPADRDIEKFQLSRGHDPKMLKEVGFDFLMPYCEGRHKKRETEEIEKVIDYLAPMDVYLHTTIRRDPPHNYKLPPKGPEYIKSIINWGMGYSRINPRFKGMSFFNEVKLPEENRQAVYDSIL